MTRYRIFAEEYVHDHRPINAWVRSFEAEADNGHGLVHFTLDAVEAMEFATAVDAIVFLDTGPNSPQPGKDGEPEIPLLAFNVRVETVPSAEDDSVPDAPGNMPEQPPSAV